MFGIGPLELVVIAVIALVVVGPKRLPQMMRQAGRFFVQARNTVNDVRGTFDGVIRDAENEIRKEEADKIRELYAAQTEQDDQLEDQHHDDDHHHDPHHHGHYDDSGDEAPPAPPAADLDATIDAPEDSIPQSAPPPPEESKAPPGAEKKTSES